MAETSDRVSSIAAFYFGKTRAQILHLLTIDPGRAADDIAAMSASLVRQDETRGKRSLFKRVFGGRRADA
jgi:hypothetical protein